MRGKMWLIVHVLDLESMFYVSVYMENSQPPKVQICTDRPIIRKGCDGDRILLISVEVCVMFLYKLL